MKSIVQFTSRFYLPDNFIHNTRRGGRSVADCKKVNQVTRTFKKMLILEYDTPTRQLSRASYNFQVAFQSIIYLLDSCLELHIPTRQLSRATYIYQVAFYSIKYLLRSFPQHNIPTRQLSRGSYTYNGFRKWFLNMLHNSLNMYVGS